MTSVTVILLQRHSSLTTPKPSNSQQFLIVFFKNYCKQGKFLQKNCTYTVVSGTTVPTTACTCRLVGKQKEKGRFYCTGPGNTFTRTNNPRLKQSMTLLKRFVMGKLKTNVFRLRTHFIGIK